MLCKAQLKSCAVPAICIYLWLLTLFYACKAEGLVVDEAVHVPQIWVFMRGVFAVHPLLTTIPTYHLVMAGLMKILSLQSVQGMRCINAVFGLISAVLFNLIRRALGAPHTILYTASFFFLPLLYPYYFLIYTDTFSLVLTLGSFLAALKQRHISAALLLTFSLLVRQNNVVWAAFVPLFCAYSYRDQRVHISDTWAKLKHIVWPYSLPIAVFFAYWLWHGSISLSKAETNNHPDLSLHPGNLYLSLFLFLIFFPYDAFLGIKRFIGFARHRAWILLIPLILVLCTHLRGSPDNYIATHYYLRNALIQIVSQPPGEWAFAAIVAIAFCAMAYTQFLLRQGRLIYVFSAFYICSSWLIENRYLIIPFALWMALRKTDDAKPLWWNLVLWAPTSLFFAWGIFSFKFML